MPILSEQNLFQYLPPTVRLSAHVEAALPIENWDTATAPPGTRCCVCGGRFYRIIHLPEPPPGYPLAGHYCAYCLKIGLLRERQIAFEYAYAGLSLLSERLDSRSHHYRTHSGHLLTALDEVVRALEAGEI